MRTMEMPSVCWLGLLITVLALWSAIFPQGWRPLALDLPQDRLLERIRFLSDPTLQGRGIGSPGLARAADYIAQAFASCGLVPAGDRGTFLQEFSAAGPASLGPRNALVFRTAKTRVRQMELSKDWQPLFFSANGHAEGPAIFVGYGVTDPENGIDDYAGVDARGKIALALRYEPDPRAEPGSRPSELTLQSDLRFKAAAAAKHEALALVVISGPKDASSELPSLEEGWALGSTSLPVVMVRRKALVPQIEEGLMPQWLPADRSERPAGAPLPGLRVELDTDLRRSNVALHNVLALKPGRSSRVVVVGAHYDHLGTGGRESLAETPGEIHPGADDNASGTALVVEMACEMARNEDAHESPPVLFAAFAGEEQGLLGSTYYVQHPAVPLADTAAMINLDMVGRLRNGRLVVFGTGTAREFPYFMASVSRELGVMITSQGDGYGPSDHTPFAAERIPVLHFFTGAHADYHRPTDTWEKINPSGMVTVGRAVAETIRLIDARPQPLTPGQPQPAPKPLDGGGYGAYLGIIPDFSRSSKGVLLAGVRDASPAALAGLRKGDTLIELGGVSVEDLYDLTYALRSRQPGDLVTIRFLRAGRRHDCEARLAKR